MTRAATVCHNSFQRASIADSGFMRPCQRSSLRVTKRSVSALLAGGLFMKAENISRMGKQVRENMADIAEKARDLSSKVKERLDDTYNDLGRTVRRAKVAAEERLYQVRRPGKSRPPSPGGKG